MEQEPLPPTYQRSTLSQKFCYTFCPNRISIALWVLGAVFVFVGAIILIAAASGSTWQSGQATDQNVGWFLVGAPLALFVGGTGLWLLSELTNCCSRSRRKGETAPPYQA